MGVAWATAAPSAAPVMSQQVAVDLLQWKPDMIERALARAKGHMIAKRRTFWEIFTDYEVVRGTVFLSLGQAVFDAFADPSKTSVNICAVFAAVIVLSDMSADSMVEFLGKVYSAGSGVRREDMGVKHWSEALQHAAQALVVLGMCEPLTTAQLTALGKDLSRRVKEPGAVLDKDGVVTFWCTNSAVQAIAQRVREYRRNLSAFAQGAPIKALADFGTAAPAVDTEKPQPGNLMSSHSRRLAQLNRAYSASSKLLAEVDQDSKSVVMSLRGLRNTFIREVDSSGELDRLQFQTVIARQFPQLSASSTPEILFDAFDTDNNGKIDYKEFATGLCKRVEASVQDKLTLLIEAYSDGAESLEVSVICNLVDLELRELSEIAVLTEELFLGNAKSASSEISQAVFERVLEEHPVVLHFLWTAIRPKETIRVARQFHNLKSKRLTGDMLLDEWTRLWLAQPTAAVGGGRPATAPSATERPRRSSVSSVPGMDRSRRPSLVAAPVEKEIERMVHIEEFDEMLIARLRVSHATAEYEICMDTFRALAGTNESIALAQLFCGLMHVIGSNATPKHQAMSLFRTFDTNASGTLDATELRELLVATRDNASQAAKATKKLLRGRGATCTLRVLDLQEIMASSDAAAACLGSLFGLQVDAPTARDTVAEIRRLLMESGNAALNTRVTFRKPLPLDAEAQTGLERMRRHSLRTAGTVIKELNDELFQLPQAADANVASPTSAYRRKSVVAVRAATKAYAGMLAERMSATREHLRQEVSRQKHEAKLNARPASAGPTRGRRTTRTPLDLSKFGELSPSESPSAVTRNTYSPPPPGTRRPIDLQPQASPILTAANPKLKLALPRPSTAGRTRPRSTAVEPSPITHGVMTLTRIISSPTTLNATARIRQLRSASP